MARTRLDRTMRSGLAGALLALIGGSGAAEAETAKPSLAPPPAPAAAAPAPAPEPKRAAAAAPIAVPPPVKLSEDPHPSYAPDSLVLISRAAAAFREIAQAGGWPTNLPADLTLLKPNETRPGILALRARLAVTGDLPADQKAGSAFDAGLIDALKRFQARHGLDETGLVGPKTLAALNVPVEDRIRQLDASAHRLLGSTFGFGSRYVLVNIPAATVEAVQNGVVAHRYVAIVGKTDRPSPTVETRITTVNVNPTWTVPVSLIKKDIIPHMRHDPGYVAKMHIRILDAAGAEVDPATIDWSGERAVNYTVRQDPGDLNSLGRLRIDMPNKHAVYMHDTPSKRLFARTTRLNSSGCVRVAGVRDLAAWLLEGTPGPAATPAPAPGQPTLPGPPAPQANPGAEAKTGWGPAEIDAAIASGQRIDVKLAKPVPVAWVYLTGFVTADGIVHFRDDAYALDPIDVPLPAGPLNLDDLVTSALPRKP